MRSSLSIFDDPASAALTAAAYEAFREIIVPPSLFYMPLSLLADGSAVASLSPYFPGQAAAYLARHLSLVLERCAQEVARCGDGFEFWVGNTVRSGDTAYLHVDHDEALRHRSGEMRCPLAGSIYHLGPERGLEGGETLFDLHPPAQINPHTCFATAPLAALQSACAAPLLVPRHPGRLIVFAGDLLHAVAPIRRCDPGSPRVALLANLWASRLSSVEHGVCALTSDEYRGLRRGQ